MLVASIDPHEGHGGPGLIGKGRPPCSTQICAICGSQPTKYLSSLAA